MASRYWVGGNGTWNSSNTTNWSTSSGGSGGASVPTSADAAVFDANSGVASVTAVSGEAVCATLDPSGGVSVTLSGAISIYDSGSLSTNLNGCTLRLYGSGVIAGYSSGIALGTVVWEAGATATVQANNGHTINLGAVTIGSGASCKLHNTVNSEFTLTSLTNSGGSALTYVTANPAYLDLSGAVTIASASGLTITGINVRTGSLIAIGATDGGSNTNVIFSAGDGLFWSDF